MVGFFIGLLVGGFIGVSIMAVCNCASTADAHLKANDDNCDCESYIDDENFDYRNQEQEGDF